MKTKIKRWQWLGTMAAGAVIGQSFNWFVPVGKPAYAVTGNQVGVKSSGDTLGTISGNQNVFANLAKTVVPSVVNISAMSPVQMGFSQGSPEDFFREFFGNQNSPRIPRGQVPRRLPKAVALGTGFIIDPSGIIMTNNHVVANANEIKIQLTESDDDPPIDGKVIARDPDLDVALIQVRTPRPLTSLPLGDSDTLAVGEYVMAVGNPFGQGHSVSHGIVSAKGRLAPGIPLASYIQTDAPINPGNSGGPLLNLRGEVIGINNAIDARAQGISFAIPINFVKTVLAQLKTQGKVTRGYIGAAIGQLTPEIASKTGAPKDLRAPFVTHVTPGGPADRAGIRPYDAITEVGTIQVHTPAELVLAVTSSPVGKSIPFSISRSGKMLSLSVTMATRPGTQIAAKGGGDQEKSSNSGPDTGMTLAETPLESGTGVVVNQVEPYSPAAKAGIMEGDVILEIDRKSIKTVKQYYEQITQPKSYLLRIQRSEPGSGNLYSVVILDLKEDGKSDTG